MLSPFDLVAGQQLPPASFTLTLEEARSYIQAVAGAPTQPGDGPEPVPPLLVTARGLRQLMATVALPPGTIHSGQECEFFSATTAGRPLQLTASVGRALTRQGQRFLTLEMRVLDGGRPICSGRTALIIPYPANAPHGTGSLA